MCLRRESSETIYLIGAPEDSLPANFSIYIQNGLLKNQLDNYESNLSNRTLQIIPL